MSKYLVDAALQRIGCPMVQWEPLALRKESAVMQRVAGHSLWLELMDSVISQGMSANEVLKSMKCSRDIFLSWREATFHIGIDG